MSEALEADRRGDAPHPRLAARLFGQATAEAAFLEAWNTGRAHHGWLLTGASGIGKATLAWRIARFLLTDPTVPADTLDPAPGHPALSRIRALSEPGLMLIRRPWDEKAGKLKTQITVDEVRRLGGFFALSSTGRRVVIVDPADDLNPSAANAILKLLEEPPARTTLLLVSHQPARLLPTIRSRCRVLRLSPLPRDALEAAVEQAGGAPEATAALAEGSAGAALDLSRGGAETYAALLDLFAGSPLDRTRARALADACAGKAGAARLDATMVAVERLLHRTARAGLLGPPDDAPEAERRVMERLAPHDAASRLWAKLAQDIGDRAAHARAVNVDPAAIVWDALAQIDGLARRL